MLSYLYYLLGWTEIENNNEPSKHRKVITPESLIKTKEKIFKKNYNKNLKKPTNNDKNLNIKPIDNLNINKEDLIKCKNKLKKNITKPSYIKDHFLEELNKARNIVFKKSK